MNLSFAKMHGLGNDFVVLDLRQSPVQLSTRQIRQIADRHRGVGFDQMLCLEPPSNPSAEFAFSIFNADGGRAQQCGNGARCVARYLERKCLIDSDKFLIESQGAMIGVKLEGDGTVSCDMGAPSFEPAQVPFRADRRAARYELSADGETVSVGVVSMGNPHAVLMVDDVDTAPVERLGAVLECHADFPEHANIGFMQVTARDEIRLRVYERGVGETRACGTGACAAVAIGRCNGDLDERVSVHLCGGTLEVSWGGESSSVWMRGPATWVFEGTIEV